MMEGMVDGDERKKKQQHTIGKTMECLTSGECEVGDCEIEGMQIIQTREAVHSASDVLHESVKETIQDFQSIILMPGRTGKDMMG